MKRSKPYIEGFYDPDPEPKMKTIELPSGRRIGPGQPCFLVAEIGQNHQGDVYTALRLISEAHKAGFDAVKLCKRDLASEMTRELRNRPYDNPHSFGRTYGLHREALELSIDDYTHLAERMRYNGYEMELFATACDRTSLYQLEAELDPPLYKVASRDLDNWPLLEAIAETGKPVILSTGMARDNEEIDAALEIIWSHHHQVILLYCLSEYPTPDDHVHLTRIWEFRTRYGIRVGFSDHTVGIHLAQAAVTIGACVLEKHITLSRAMPGTDHAASLEPAGMQKLVRNIRSVERGLELGPDWYHPEVQKPRAKLGRSLVSLRAIRPGEEITEADVCLKSPGNGIHWPDRDRILGRPARVHIPEDVTLQVSDVIEAPETD